MYEVLLIQASDWGSYGHSAQLVAVGDELLRACTYSPGAIHIAFEYSPGAVMGCPDTLYFWREAGIAVGNGSKLLQLMPQNMFLRMMSYFRLML